MNKDAFKPQGREISVMGMGNPLMGQGNVGNRMIQMGAPPVQGRQQPTPVPQRGGGASIGNRTDAFKPIGTPVRIIGSSGPTLDGGAVDRSASFQPSQSPLAPMPVVQPEMGEGPMAAPARPFLQRNQGTMLMRVVLRGIGPDGNPYEAPYDGEFLQGTHSFSVNFAPLT